MRGERSFAKQQRTSIVKKLTILDISFSSTLFIGDFSHYTPVTRALAVQREIPRFQGKEGRFSDFDIFVRAVPIWPVDEEVHIKTEHRNAVIMADEVEVPYITISSLVHIGSSQSIRAESRIKHIRQLLRSGRDAPS